MKNVFAVVFLILFSTLAEAGSKKSPCREFRDDENVVLPVTIDKAYDGTIVLSDGNPNPCKRIYLVFLKEALGRPFFLHYNEIITKKMWDEAQKWRE